MYTLSTAFSLTTLYTSRYMFLHITQLFSLFVQFVARCLLKFLHVSPLRMIIAEHFIKVNWKKKCIFFNSTPSMLCICVCATENRVGMTEKCCLFSPPPSLPLVRFVNLTKTWWLFSFTNIDRGRSRGAVFLNWQKVVFFNTLLDMFSILYQGV